MAQGSEEWHRVQGMAKGNPKMQLFPGMAGNTRSGCGTQKGLKWQVIPGMAERPRNGKEVQKWHRILGMERFPGVVEGPMSDIGSEQWQRVQGMVEGGTPGMAQDPRNGSAPVKGRETQEWQDSRNSTAAQERNEVQRMAQDPRMAPGPSNGGGMHE